MLRNARDLKLDIGRDISICGRVGQVIKDFGHGRARRIGVTTVYASHIGYCGRKRELRIKILHKGGVLRTTDAASEESQEGCRGDAALGRGARQLREEA